MIGKKKVNISKIANIL